MKKLFIAVAAVCSFVSVGLAQDITWSGDVLPSDPTNWNSSVNAYVGYTNSGSVSVTGSGQLDTRNVTIGSDSGSDGLVVISSGGVWTNEQFFNVGYSGEGSLIVTNGGQLYGSTKVGVSGSGVGTATVDGSESLLDAGDYWVYVGEHGTGTLNVTSGGTVAANTSYLGYFNDSDGTVNISGAGSVLTNSATLEVARYGSSTLTISDGGTAYNTDGYIGHYDATPFGDYVTGLVTVADSGSVWTNAGDLYVGDAGNGVLEITNGGVVYADNGFIADDGGSFGAVSVDGSGSSLILSNGLYVANGGTGSLEISDGGMVNNAAGYIGRGSMATGVVTVTGSGTIWSNSSNLFVGDYGRGELIISNGATVFAGSSTFIAAASNSTGRALVSGAGSVWTNAASLYVGYVGDGSLMVTNGGAVYSGSSTIGWGDESSGKATVTGSNSLWQVRGSLNIEGGSLDVLSGGVVASSGVMLSANSDSVATLTVAGADSVLDSASGSISLGSASGTELLSITNGGVVNSSRAVIGMSGSDSSALVSGEGSVWNNSGDFYVGYMGGLANATTGQVTIAAGGVVNSGSGYIGAGFFGAAPGAVTVSGAGSAWNNETNLYVGAGYGVGLLDVSEGGTLTSTTGYVGFITGSTGMVTIADSGSVWTNDASLYVGYNGVGTLNITNNGTVVSQVGYIGYETNGVGSVLVDNATWTNTGELIVGRTGIGHMDITDGGSVYSATGVVGYASGSVGEVAVSGSGSVWSNMALAVGFEGTGTLSVANGGEVVASIAALGYTNNGLGTATIDGGSLSVASDFMVGNLGNGELIVTNGGSVSAANSYLGNAAGAFGSALVTGAGSVWTNSEFTYVGNYGSGELTISDGGAVYDRRGYIGYESGSTGSVTVAGADSLWTSELYTYVGNDGVGSLMITNGGTVISENGGYIGFRDGSVGSATVDGAGSVWTNESWFEVGYAGDGTLSVTNGGAVYSRGGIVGSASGSTGAATVSGTGSVWSNQYTLVIGENGSGDLTIADGGAVYSASGYVGNQYGSTGWVTVTGANSVWANAGDLYVGNYGSGDLTIADGGAVYSGESYVGYDGEASVSISGSNSLWSISDNLYVSYFADADLTVSDGGTLLSSGASYIGNSAYKGLVTVSGEGSSWTNSGTMSIGANRGGGTLVVTNGGAVAVDSFIMIASTPGSEGRLVVTGADSEFSTSDILEVGRLGNGSMLVSDGATVSSQAGRIACLSGSTGSALVTGSDSVWTNAGHLYVGSSASGALSITNGGTVHNNRGYIGYNSGSDGAVTVTGSGSIWNNSDSLYLGRYGSGGLNVLDGGSVLSKYGYIAAFASDATGAVTLDGTNSSWDVEYSLFVGNQGAGSLSISNGAAVSSASASIGNYAGATGTVIVAGSGSSWTNAGEMVLAENGSATLDIADGGRVVTETLKLYTNGTVNLAASGNLAADTIMLDPVSLQGSGTAMVHGVIADMDVVFDGSSKFISQLDSGATLYVDASGDGMLGAGWLSSGSLVITNGAQVVSADGYIGYGNSSFGTGIVTGAESSWTVTNQLRVGYGNYSYGELNVLDGATVVSGSAELGSRHSATGVAVVSGAGSAWTNSGNINVGEYADSSLVVSNSGAVYADNVYVGPEGYMSSAHGTLTVDGSNSLLVANSMSVGEGDTGSGALTITNGGSVVSDYGYIGTGGGEGAVTVTGTDSSWDVDGCIDIGSAGQGTLSILDNATVTAEGFYLGGAMSVSTVNLAGGGTLHITEDARLSSTSVLSFELADDEESGKLVVDGNLVNPGTTLKLWSAGNLEKYAEHELICAGDIDNPFDVSTNDILSVYAVTVTQTVDEVASIDAGVTQFVDKVSAIVDGVRDQYTDAPSMAKASVATVNVALNNISRHASVARQAFRNRASSVGVPAGAAGPDERLLSGEWIGYMRNFNDIGGLDSGGGVKGFDWNTTGYMVGLEKQVADQMIVGGGGGQSWTDLDGVDGAGGGASRMLLGSVYGSWFNEDSYYECGLLYARSDNDAERIDTASETYTGSYDAEMFGGWLEAGWVVCRKGDTELEPYVRSTYVSGHQDGYTDAGGSAPMTVSANTTDNWQVEGGARMIRNLTLKDLGQLRLEFKAGVQCELLDSTVTVNTLVAGDSQRASSPDADRAAVILGGRADLGVSDSFEIGVGYEPTISGDWYNHLIDCTVKYSF